MKLIEKNVITGTVTATNLKLCTFTLDDNLLINMPHLMLHNKRQSFPRIGENVSIREHYHSSEDPHKCIFLCDKSILNCEGVFDGSSRTDHKLLNAIEKHRLSVVDLENVYANNRVIEEFIVGLRVASAEEVITSILDESVYGRKEGKTDSCFESTRPRFLLKTISDCRYTDETNEKYSHFPYWTFGVHQRRTGTEILIGYFYLSRHTGIPFFKDVKYRVPCCVLTRTSHDLVELNDRLILIKNCRVFTEVFNENSVVPLEYLVFSVDDVIVLKRSRAMETESKFYVKRPPNAVAFKYNFKFLLLKKSSVMWTNKNAPECWLKILTLRNGGNEQEFLALNFNYVDVAAFLKTGEAYELFHSEELSPCFSKEIRRLEHGPCRLLSEKSAVFVSSAHTEDEHLSLLSVDDDVGQLILSVREAQDVMKTSNDLLSFQGVIHAKEFVDPIESRTAAGSTPVGFGTLGSKTHLLHFASDTSVKLALFLNNWERLQLPLGLIPGMRVSVSNVVPQKNAYLKSTVLTTFTILGYEPRIQFCSVNLRGDFYGQGRTTCLCCCRLIPGRVLINVSVSKISVRSIRITCRCKTCNKTTPCDCQDPRVDLKSASMFFVADHSGRALMKTERLQVLKSVLELKERQWSKFLKAIELLGTFEYGKDCTSKGKAVLHEAVQHTINVATASSLRNLELHCFSTEQKSPDVPILNCIYAKAPVGEDESFFNDLEQK